MLPFYWQFSKSLHRLNNRACVPYLLKPDHDPLENKRILTYWTTGMDRKSKLVWCEELWMQTHPTYCQDLTPRPGWSARNSEAGGAPVNIYSIWRNRVKGCHGSDYSNSRSVWADEREGEGLWERWKDHGKQPDDQVRTQTVCLDGLLFITGWYWVGIKAPSRNHNTNQSAWLQLEALYQSTYTEPWCSYGR